MLTSHWWIAHEVSDITHVVKEGDVKIVKEYASQEWTPFIIHISFKSLAYNFTIHWKGSVTMKEGRRQP